MHLFRIMFIAFALLYASGSLVAQANSAKDTAPKPVQFTEEKISLIEDNLVKDLESPIPGVVIGGAQTVREMKKAVPAHDFTKLTIPLMRIVKDESGDRAARIIAALALHEVKSDRGDFAISREGEMSSDEVFKSLCSNLAKVRASEQKK